MLDLPIPASLCLAVEAWVQGLAGPGMLFLWPDLPREQGGPGLLPPWESLLAKGNMPSEQSSRPDPGQNDFLCHGAPHMQLPTFLILQGQWSLRDEKLAHTEQGETQVTASSSPDCFSAGFWKRRVLRPATDYEIKIQQVSFLGAPFPARHFVPMFCIYEFPSAANSISSFTLNLGTIH